LLMCIALMIAVAIVSRRRNYAPSRSTKATRGELGQQLMASFWALLLPFGILLGLRFGVFTPTEAGAAAVLYAVVIGAFIYRELRWAHVPAILMESALATAGIMFIICSAVAFSSYLNWEGIPKTVATLLTDTISSPWVMLLLINILLLVIGTFFEGSSAMIVMAPLFVPVILKMGIDPIHFGIVMSVNLVIAEFTPPIGTMMFTTISIANAKVADYVRECWPFLIALIAVLFLITFVPQLVLFLPNLLMPR
jgi:tripartite ATP-independent transporter DctM subunit